MKKNYFQWIVSILTAGCMISLAACASNDDLERSTFQLDSSTIELQKNESTQFCGDESTHTIAVQALDDVKWSASVITGADFITVSPTETQSGNGTITITVAKNSTDQLRNATIEIKNSLNASKKVVELVQKADENVQDLVAIRFAVLSDLHFGSTDPIKRVGRSLETIVKEDPKVDAVFLVGDLTQSARENQFSDLMKTVTEKLPSSMPVYYMMGNHDYYQANGKDLYLKYTNQPLNQFIEKNDFHFITLSVSSSYNLGMSCYSDETRDFLAEKMKVASEKYPDKPIFVFGHIPNSNTVWGTSAPDNWASGKLETVLKQYPQTIFFSGHLHYPLCDERSIHQEYFTSVNDGGNDYGELIVGLADGVHPIGSQELQEIMIVEVDKQFNVTIRKINTNKGEEIKTPWVIEAPHDKSKFRYTANRLKPAPSTFDPGDQVQVSEISFSNCLVTFPQATNDDIIYSYEITLLNEQGVADRSPIKIFSQCWLGSSMPITLSWRLSDLKPETKYSISVKGEDSFGQKSEVPIVSKPFTTRRYEPSPDAKAPKADMFDISFRPFDTAVDISSMALPITTPNIKPFTQFNSDLNMWTSKFYGNKNYYFMADYSKSTLFMDGMKSSFTYEVYARTAKTGDMCPMGAQENGGLGIQQDNLNGTAYQAWAHIGGKYQSVPFGTSTVSPDKYNHFVYTYDGTKIVTYMNGLKVKSLNCNGDLKFPQEVIGNNIRWICVGGDATSENNGYSQAPFSGDIAVARMYSKAASQDEVYLLYEQLLTRQSDDMRCVFALLNKALTQTIPMMSDTVKKEALLKEGWDLMNNMGTTLQQVAIFLNKL